MGKDEQGDSACSFWLYLMMPGPGGHQRSVKVFVMGIYRTFHIRY